MYKRQVTHNTPTAAVLVWHTRETHLIYGTLRQSPTRSLTSPHLPCPKPVTTSLLVSDGRCGGCDPSSGGTIQLSSSRWKLVYTRTADCTTINREPTRCPRLAEHARHPGAVAARLGSKQRPRAARAEAARAGRWWRRLDSKTDDNGNAMFQSNLFKLSKKRTGLKIRSYRRYGEHGEKMFFQDYLLTLLYAVELALSR